MRIATPFTFLLVPFFASRSGRTAATTVSSRAKSRTPRPPESTSPPKRCCPAPKSVPTPSPSFRGTSTTDVRIPLPTPPSPTRWRIPSSSPARATTCTHRADIRARSIAIDPLYALASREHAKNQKYLKPVHVERLHGFFTPLAFTTYVWQRDPRRPPAPPQDLAYRRVQLQLFPLRASAFGTASAALPPSRPSISDNALIVHARRGRMVENY